MKILIQYNLALFAATALVSLYGLAADVLSLAPVGWTQLENTRIRTVCPNIASIQGNTGCTGVTAAWNSGVFDTVRNRLIIWGGGHNDYLGNEIYSLNLSTNPITMTRLTEPSTAPISGGATDNPLQAGSRHTYDHIVYMSHIDSMFVFGGAIAPSGFMQNDTWTFDFLNLRWNKRSPSSTKPEANYGRVTVYNPTTKKVYIHDQFNLYAYSFETDSYALLASDAPVSQEMTGVFDSKRQLFLSIGGGQVSAYDVSAGSSYKRQIWATSGGAAIVNSSNPGVAYDPVSDRIVAWSGGNTVYTLDPGATNKVWTAVTYPNGPGGAIATGTFKRWAYSASSNAFVVVNSVDNNAFAFKLTAGAGTPLPAPTQLVAPKNLRIN